MIVKVLKGLGVTLLITLSAFVLGILIGMLISLIFSVSLNNPFFV